MTFRQRFKNKIKNEKEGKSSSLSYFRSKSRSIRIVLAVSYTFVSFIMMAVLAIAFNRIAERNITDKITENAENTAEQTVASIEEYLVNMRNISEALYYDVIKNKDVGTETLYNEMNLLYAANADSIVSVALFRQNGTLVNAAPVTQVKDSLDVTQQSWFLSALSGIDSMHFSAPHVQNIFISQSYKYNWVISLSMSVDITENNRSQKGVLLVDMNYEKLSYLLHESNGNTNQYAYLCESDGSLIYHPSLSQINAGLEKENNTINASYKDGVTNEEWEGQKRIVIVDTIAYTGWKLITIVPASTLRLNTVSIRNIIVLMVILIFLITIILNQFIAERISRPLVRLNDAIANMEGVTNLPENIYSNGSQEVQELGDTLHSYISQINRLMDDIVKEEEAKRKSELDALQAQINPHFLYNTLDSIVWMIEGEKSSDAVYMITQLASFFRMSLNRGKSIISIENEIKQAKAYLNIQKIRYKESFQAYYDVPDEVNECLIVKLVVQPILENAIYHGIKDADQDGEIRIKGWKEGNDIFISISDNGYGMTQEEVNQLLDESKRPAIEKHGSGVGLINVHNRLRLRFGSQYGLSIQSELDEGTTVTIHIPAITATEDNMNIVENEGKLL